MYGEREINLITFCSLDGVSDTLKYKLAAELAGDKPDLKKFESLLIKSLAPCEYNKLKAQYCDADFRKKLFENLDKKGISCVAVCSENYPKLLKQTADPPLVLYCKGNTALLKTKCFAVVGSRRCPVKTVAETKKIAGELSEVFTVVSGIAEGGDAAALEGALKTGKVISVLAYGFDYIYPAMNAQLLRRVEAEGLAITEYPPDTPPKNYQFPARNRIIAGTCLGTLVVSAAKKSGALITADIARQYDREIFAFPHSIGAPAGEGCNALIKDGAHLAENILDILKPFGLDLTLPKGTDLAGDELEAYELLCEEGDLFMPVLAERLGKQVYQILTVVSKLELKGRVVRLGGNVISAIKQ
ncbi:MAG: DNA-processing protein DprA [Clostridia bacterium]|nr:DNA-processing protein DprA [Clostridia bacterium]